MAKRFDLNKDGLLKTWQDDEKANDIIVRAVSGDEKVLQEFAECAFAACTAYAEGFRHELEHFAHQGNEVEDVALEMFLDMYQALPVSAKKDNPKRYLVTTAMNAGRHFRDRESTTFGALSKGNTDARKLMVKALSGEKIECNDPKQDFFYKHILPSSNGFVFLETIANPDSDIFIDNHSSEDNARVECEQTGEKFVREFQDPLMRIIMTGIATMEPAGECYNLSARERMTKQYLKEEYGVDDDLFDPTLRRVYKVRDSLESAYRI